MTHLTDQIKKLPGRRIKDQGVKICSVTCSIIHVQLTELTYTHAARNDQGHSELNYFFNEFSLMFHLMSVYDKMRL